jgi:hypothetical protein
MEGTRPVGRPTCSQEDSIKINLIEREQEGTDWIYSYLGQNRETSVRLL